MRAAARWGKPPSAMLLGDSTRDWTDRDMVAAMAWEIYQAELCPECGNPRKKCREGHTQFEVETYTCKAKEAVEQITQREDYKPRPGDILIPEPYDATEDPAYADLLEWQQQLAEEEGQEL